MSSQNEKQDGRNVKVLLYFDCQHKTVSSTYVNSIKEHLYFFFDKMLPSLLIKYLLTDFF